MLNRPYIIAATIALILIVIFLPAGEKLANQSISSTLRANVASAAIQCSDETVTADIKLTISKVIPERNLPTDPGVASGDQFPYVLIEKVSAGGCIGCANTNVFYYKGTEIERVSWCNWAFCGAPVQSYQADYKSRPEGGLLADKYEVTTWGFYGTGGPLDPLSATYISYTESSEEIHENVTISEAMGDVNIGSLKDLAGLTDPGSDINMREKIKVQVSTAIGSGLKVWLSDGAELTRQNYNENTLVVDSLGVFGVQIVACKDSDNDGNCDHSQCELAPLCSDGIDNDADGKIDFPSDPGCDSLTDGDETDAPKMACEDGIDNDGDGDIDFPSDSGCSTPADNDETNPPIDRNISIGGGGFIDRDPNKYPISILVDEPNNYQVKIQHESNIELVPLTPTHTFSENPTEPLQNSQPYYFLLQGISQNGKKQLAIKEGRYWNLSCVNDSSVTSPALIDFFAGGNSLDQCIDSLRNFPSISSLVLDPVLFQVFLDMISICLLNEGTQTCVPSIPAGTGGVAAPPAGGGGDTGGDTGGGDITYSCTDGAPVTVTLSLNSTSASEVTETITTIFDNGIFSAPYSYTFPTGVFLKTVTPQTYSLTTFFELNGTEAIPGVFNTPAGVPINVNHEVTRIRAVTQINFQVSYTDPSPSPLTYSQQVTLTEADGTVDLGTIASLTGWTAVDSAITISISPENIAQKGFLFLGNSTSSDLNSNILLCKDAHNGLVDGIDGTCDFNQCQ